MPIIDSQEVGCNWMLLPLTQFDRQLMYKKTKNTNLDSALQRWVWDFRTRPSTDNRCVYGTDPTNDIIDLIPSPHGPQTERTVNSLVTSTAWKYSLDAKMSY